MITTTSLLAALLVAQAPSPSISLTPRDASSMPPPHRARLLERAWKLRLVGVCALISSGGFLFMMLDGLVTGAQDAHDHDFVVADANRDMRPLYPFEREVADNFIELGQQANRIAIAGGATAGVVALVGVAFLGRAHVLRHKAAGLGPLALPRGFGVGWRLQF